MGLVALVRLTKNRAVFSPINHVVVVVPPLGVLLLLLTPTHPSFTSLSSMPAWSCPGREVKKSENAGDVPKKVLHSRWGSGPGGGLTTHSFEIVLKNPRCYSTVD